MSKEKQIEEMVRIASKCITSWLNNETPKALPDYIAEALYNVGYRKQEWISVDERLPESPSEILVSCCDGVRMMLYEGNNRWWYDPNYMGTAEAYEITHWKPLPDPAKKGGAE